MTNRREPQAFATALLHVHEQIQGFLTARRAAPATDNSAVRVLRAIDADILAFMRREVPDPKSSAAQRDLYDQWLRDN